MVPGLLSLTLLTACLAGMFWIFQRMVLMVLDAIREDHARRTFPWHRERLEFRFLQALERRSPQESRSWTRACWTREICWARDRTTRALLILISVEFPDEYDLGADSRKMAVFEYRNGTWYTEGRYIDSPTPAAACEAAHLDAIGPRETRDDRP